MKPEPQASKSPSPQDVKLFVSFAYATDALKFARFDCDRLSRVANENSMEWFSGITSLVAHYARPFKRSNDLQVVPDDYVPQAYREVHQRFVRARDKAHVHLDGNARAGNGGVLIHQVRLVKQRDGRHFWTPARILFIERSEILTIKALIGELLNRLDIETDRLESLLLPSISPLRPGLYFLSPDPPLFQQDKRNDGIEALDELGPIN
jgi:hypothetical protein